jgi:uncharacterized membrane protein YfcA
MARIETASVPFHGNVPPIAWLALLSAAGMAAYLGALSHLGLSDPAIATVAAVAFAAVVAGIAGFAFSAICGAILFQFRHDTVGVVEIMLICSLANQVLNVWLLRRDLHWGRLSPFLLGGVVGVPLGVWLLLHLDAHSFKLALGTLLVVYGGVMLARRPMTLTHVFRGSDLSAGLIGGLIGGFSATPGAAMAIWCGMKPWDKLRQRAVLQPYILCMQLVALVAIPALHGHAGPSIAIPPVAWVCLPVGMLGTWWGMALFKRMTDRQFTNAVNVLLIVSGIGLVA